MVVHDVGSLVVDLTREASRELIEFAVPGELTDFDYSWRAFRVIAGTDPSVWARGFEKSRLSPGGGLGATDRERDAAGASLAIMSVFGTVLSRIDQGEVDETTYDIRCAIEEASGSLELPEDVQKVLVSHGSGVVAALLGVSHEEELSITSDIGKRKVKWFLDKHATELMDDGEIEQRIMPLKNQVRLFVDEASEGIEVFGGKEVIPWGELRAQHKVMLRLILRSMSKGGVIRYATIEDEVLESEGDSRLGRSGRIRGVMRETRQMLRGALDDVIDPAKGSDYYAIRPMSYVWLQLPTMDSPLS
jgi:hypothetical protein